VAQANEETRKKIKRRFYYLKGKGSRSDEEHGRMQEDVTLVSAELMLGIPSESQLLDSLSSTRA